MKPRDIAFAVLGIAVAAVCVRLGVWQLSRLDGRRAFNAAIAQRAAAAPVPISELPTDTGNAHYRRARVEGTYDFGSEIVLTSRSRAGSPGVNIITPLKRSGTDTAVLVNRGWIYAPDGMTADLSKWREPAAASGTAYVETYAAAREGEIRSSGRPRAYRWLDRTGIAGAFPYPIAPYYIVLVPEGAETVANVPPRLGAPPLDEGPHKSYAFQWFSFAAISIIGMFLFLRRK